MQKKDDFPIETFPSCDHEDDYLDNFHEINFVEGWDQLVEREIDLPNVLPLIYKINKIYLFIMSLRIYGSNFLSEIFIAERVLVVCKKFFRMSFQVFFFSSRL